jgi:trehalose synthase-like protein
MSVNGAVDAHSLDPRRLATIIGEDRLAALVHAAAELRQAMDGRRIVNINSTATGGGVAEMLTTLLGYSRGLGIDVNWLVISGDPEFFAITKRVHNGLYGSPGDGGELGAAERAHYDLVTEQNLERLRRTVRRGDIVFVHDRPAWSPRSSSSAPGSSGDATSGSTGRTSGRTVPGRSSGRTSRPHTRTSSRGPCSPRAGSIARRCT